MSPYLKLKKRRGSKNVHTSFVLSRVLVPNSMSKLKSGMLMVIAKHLQRLNP